MMNIDIIIENLDCNVLFSALVILIAKVDLLSHNGLCFVL